MRRRIKRRYSLVAMLLVFGVGIGLLAVLLTDSLFAR